MKRDYDFSKAERGKFHRPGAQAIPPVHLEPEILAYLQARAKARGTTLSRLDTANRGHHSKSGTSKSGTQQIGDTNRGHTNRGHNTKKRKKYI